MPEIHALVLGDYQVNCYIVSPEGGRHCCLIDPGYEAPFIVKKLSGLGLTLDAIVLTHGHFDHVGAVKDIAQLTGCRVYINPLEKTMPPQLTAGPLSFTNELREGMTFTEAGLTFTALHTPGHTPGSMCFLTEGVLFAGDTLFAGSCGRTDFPGGNIRDMLSSLKRLSALPEETWVLPGHGESTTIAEEKRNNPYMRQGFPGEYL